MGRVGVMGEMGDRGIMGGITKGMGWGNATGTVTKYLRIS
jgi:hypothetical protein